MSKIPSFKEAVKRMQADELLERQVYLKLQGHIKNESDKKILLEIAEEEDHHYNIWKNYTQEKVTPNPFLLYWYVLMGILFGYTFSIKLMEKRQDAFNDRIADTYTAELAEKIPNHDVILRDEDEHERLLINMIDEEKLQYVGSIVLGLNDALVEFTGALAGWTFAMQSNRLILLAGLITGISATLSMASSEYLSSKNEGDKNALKSSIYTGLTYLFTVFMLLMPCALLPDKSYTPALLIMLVIVVAIIAAFNYYIAIAKDLSFKHKFKEMSTISLSVAAISFVIGLLVKQFLGIDV